MFLATKGLYRRMRSAHCARICITLDIYPNGGGDYGLRVAGDVGGTCAGPLKQAIPLGQV